MIIKIVRETKLVRISAETAEYTKINMNILKNNNNSNIRMTNSNISKRI